MEHAFDMYNNKSTIICMPSFVVQKKLRQEWINVFE